MSVQCSVHTSTIGTAVIILYHTIASTQSLNQLQSTIYLPPTSITKPNPNHTNHRHHSAAGSLSPSLLQHKPHRENSPMFIHTSFSTTQACQVEAQNFGWRVDSQFPSTNSKFRPIKSINNHHQKLVSTRQSRTAE